MGAGAIRDRVTILTIAGGPTGNAAAVTVRTQWAEIAPAGGKAIELGQASGYETTHTITFRDKPVVTASHIIEDSAGLRYHVRYVKTHPREKQVAFCEVVNQ